MRAKRAAPARVTTDTPLRQYVWGRYIDELIQQREGTDSETPTDYYLLSDLLYRSAALTTQEGDDPVKIAEAYDTDAYGRTLVFSGTGTDEAWFTDDDPATHAPLAHLTHCPTPSLPPVNP